MDKETKLEQTLKKYSTIGIDVPIFIYHFENNPVYKPLTFALFNLMERGEIIGVTSIISILEIIVKPKGKGEQQLVNEYKFLLNTFPNLAVGAIDDEVIDLAAFFKAKYSFDTTIAIQLATAKLYDASCFMTNNQALSKVHEIKVILISDL